MNKLRSSLSAQEFSCSFRPGVTIKSFKLLHPSVDAVACCAGRLQLVECREVLNRLI